MACSIWRDGLGGPVFQGPQKRCNEQEATVKTVISWTNFNINQYFLGSKPRLNFLEPQPSGVGQVVGHLILKWLSWV